MWLAYFFAFVATALIVARLYVKLRESYKGQPDDWDTRNINRLRKLGSDPFKDQSVDFFFALPDEAACRTISEELQRDGYRMDIKAVPESTDFAFSLHASKTMRLNVPDMQAASRRFTALAATHGGRYDGWAADVAR